MAKPRESWFDRAAPWAMFILPAVCGTLMWIRRDRFDETLAFGAWGCAALWALVILFEHYKRSGR